MAAIVIAGLSAAYALNVSADSVPRMFFGLGGFAGLPSATVPVQREVAFHEEEPVGESMSPESLVDMASARSGHTATVLADGRVLVAGGDAGGSSEIYDPASGLFVASGNLNSARTGHAALRLPDGRVLISGGTVGGAPVSSTDIFDPASSTFSPGPAMASARAGHTATALTDGNVLITGGGSDSVEIFDGTSFTSVTAPMIASRTNASAIRMSDGRIFIAGGDGLTSAEIFNPADGSFTAVGSSMTLSRSHALLRLLPDGKIQIIGGAGDGSMEVYDPSIDTIGAYAHVVPVSDPCANLINYVLRAETRSALIFNGSTAPDRDRRAFTVTELGTSAIVIGGTNSAGTALASSVVYTSSTATVTTDQLDYSPGETATIAGTGYAAGETVRVMIHEDPHTQFERGFDAVADASGNFAGTYLVQDYDLNMHFIVGARGLTSGITAQTTFTDNKNVSLGLLGTGGGTVTSTAAPALSGQVNFNCTRSGGVNTGTCLNVDFDNNAVITFTAAATAGSTIGAWSVPAAMTTVSGCASGNTSCVVNINSQTGTILLTFNGNTNTTTAVASSANPSVFGQPVTFTATVSRSSMSGSPSPTGNVQFIVDGSNFGSPVSLVSAGLTTATAATSTSALTVGSHTVSATYVPTGGFNASSGALAPNQVVNKANTTTTVTSNTLNPLAWSQIFPTGTGPSSSTCAQTSHPDGAGRLIVYARSSCGGGTGDVWVLNNANGIGTPAWSLVSNTGPSRHGQTTVYDQASNKLILFAGCSGGCLPVNNDVWVLTNANGQGGPAVWTNLSTTGGPPAARNHAAGAYDPVSNRLIIFGGQNGSGSVIGANSFTDVWVLTNANVTSGSHAWTQLTTSGTFPVGKYQSRAFYDSVTNRLTIAGGVRNDVAVASSAVNVLTNANGTGGTPAWTNLIAEGAAGAPAFAGWSVTQNTAANRGILAQATSSNLYYLNNVNGLGGTTSYTLVSPSGGGGATSQYGLGYDAPTARTMSWHLNGSTNTSFVLAPNSSSTYGNSVTFTATVAAVAPGAGTRTGNVQFLDGGVALGAPQPLSGGAASIVTSALNAGVHNITAQYIGDTNFNTSTSGILSHTVAQKALTAAIVNNPTKAYDGNTTATLTASNFNLTGLVGTETFTITKTTGTYNVASAGSRTVTTTLAPIDFTAGPGTLAANYILPTSAAGSGTITTANQTINFAALANKTYGDAPFTVSATATSGLTVSFSSLTLSVCTVSGNTVTILTGGSCTIRASQPGDSNYNAAPNVDQPFTVLKAATTTAVVSSANPSIFGQPVTFTATVTKAQGSAVPTGTVTFFDGATPIGTSPLNGSAQAALIAPSLSAGNHAITATYNGDLNYLASTSGVLNQYVDIAPTANNDSYSTTQENLLTVNAPGVLANDTDPDGPSINAVLDATPGFGTLVLNANGSFTYQPNAGYVGPDSFTYHANDTIANSNIGTVSINVTAAACVDPSFDAQWTSRASMPSANSSMGVEDVNGTLYTVGGFVSGCSGSNTLQAYDAATNTWTPRAPMPTARFFSGTASLGGKLYVVGGAVGCGAGTTVFEVYDPVANSWTTKAPLPADRYGLRLAAANGKLYAIGGQTGANIPLVDVWEYDPAMDIWTAKAPMPTGRNLHGVGVVNNRIYVVGGFSPTPVLGATAGVFIYNPAADSWSSGAPMSEARVYHGTASLNGKIYAFGGATGTTEGYDPVTDSWSAEASMMTVRSQLGGAASGGKLYGVGGFAGPTVLSSVEAYSPGLGNMAAWYPANGNGNEVVLGNNGTAVSGAGYAAGKVGQAFTFDGNDDVVTAPNRADLQVTSALTIDAWINPASTTQDQGAGVVAKGSFRTGAYAIDIIQTDGDDANARTLRFFWHLDNSTNYQVFAPYWLTADKVGTWRHIAATYDSVSGDLKLYDNGVLIAIASGVNKPAAGTLMTVNTHELSIGSRQGSGSGGGTGAYDLSFNGSIDEVEIFNRALSAAEIKSMYDASIAGKCNTVPVASNQSVSTPANSAIAITVSAADTQGNYLTYTVTTPTNGVLSGTAPNLTYTPNVGYYGPDSFTFKVNDGFFDSNIATVSIDVTCTGPTVTDNPDPVSITYGANAVFSATAVGVPSPTVQWQVSTNGGSTFNNLVNSVGSISGASSPTLTLAGPSVSQSGYLYRAVFTSTCATSDTTAAVLTVNKANAAVVVTPYDVVYDGQPHTAAVTSITGVNGETGASVGTVDVSNTTHTNAGTYAADYWFFTGTANYNDIGNTTLTDQINKADAVCTINGYTGVYDAAAHGATGSCAGVTGDASAAGSSLALGDSFTNVPGGTATWAFTGGGNYNDQGGTAAIVINKATLTITAVTNTKPYDGNNTAAATPTYSGQQGSDTVTALAEVYDNKNAGTGKTLSVSTYTVNDGNGGNNYNVNTVANNTGVINKVTLTLTAITNTKTYDGDNSAAAFPTIGGLQSGDTVTGLTETYDNKHVGTGKTLSVATYTVNDGNGGNNYIVATVPNNTGAINQKSITVTAVNDTKIYDGNTTSTGTPSISPALAGTDTSGFSQSYSTKHFGVGNKTLIPTGVVNDGNGGNNYTVTFVNFAAGTINKKPITVTAVAWTKVFDGNTSSGGIPTIAPALVGGDTANFIQTYDTPFVGTGKTLTPSGTANDGNMGLNYSYTFTPVNTGVITTIYCFNGFHSPIGGSVEAGNGGTFADPVRTFKLGSTIPVKFTIHAVGCGGTPITTGVHTLQMVKYSNAVDSDPPIDATPTDAATTGNQFRLTGTDWHYNLDTKRTLPAITAGTWLVRATLSDGSVKTVWIAIKK